MHDDAAQVTDRVQRFLAERLRPAIVRDAVPCDLAIFEVAGEPVPVAQALAARYSPVSPGYAWGPPWGTAWLRVRGHLPRDWPPEQAELAVDLGFDTSMPGFGAEGLAYDADGTVIKGIAPRNSHVPAPLLGLKSGDDLLVYVEAAANPPIMGGAESFVPTPLGSRETAGTAPTRRLGVIQLVRTDERIRALGADVEVLLGLAGVLHRTDPRRHQVLAALELMIDGLDPDDLPGGAAAARRALDG